MTIKLSKSKFVAGCECPKRLYLQVHEPDAAAEAIIEQGVVRQIVVHYIKRISFSLPEVLRFGIAC